MSIIHMASRLDEIPADAANVQDVSDDYRSSVHGQPADFKMWLYETHVGLCLEDRERNGRDDSDWDMLVWNPETQSPEWIYGFATTRGWSYPCMGSRPDATPEVRAAYAEYKRRQEEKARAVHTERLAKMPSKGKLLRVVKGRKVPIGTTGQCFWSSTEFAYDDVLGVLFKGYRGRVGIQAGKETHFTDVRNVEVVEG